jgi:hypothetical protein
LKGRPPLTGENVQATLRGRPRGRLGTVGSGKGCLRGRPRGGSGSLEMDSPIEIIAREKQKQARLVHHQRLGERERHADKTGETLA